MDVAGSHPPSAQTETIGLPARVQPPAEPPPHVPDYRFIKVIGRGAYGTVWLAEEPLAGVFRAIKVLHPPAVRSPDDGENHKSTAHIDRELAGLHAYQTHAREHPHLVRILKTGLCSVPAPTEPGRPRPELEIDADAAQPRPAVNQAQREADALGLKDELIDVRSDIARGPVNGPQFRRQTVYYVMEIADHAGGPQPHRPVDYEPLTLATILKRHGRLPTGGNASAGRGSGAGLGRGSAQGQRSNGLPPGAGVVEYATALLDAIDHLHQAGIHHRDVKPSNCLIVGGVLKLADVGLAAGDNTESIGTSGYLTPEGTPDDLYALGKVIYQMTTGLPAGDFPEWPGGLDPAGDPKSGVPAEPRLKPLHRLINELCGRSGDRRLSDVREIRRLLSDVKSTTGPGFCTTRRRALLVLCTSPLLGAFAGGWGMKWWDERSDPKRQVRGREPFDGTGIIQTLIDNGAEFTLHRKHKPNQSITIPHSQTQVRFHDLQTVMLVDPAMGGGEEWHLVVAGAVEVFNLEKPDGNPGTGDVEITDGEIDQVYLIAGKPGNAKSIMVLLYHGEPGAEPGICGRFRRKIRLAEIEDNFQSDVDIPIRLAFCKHHTPQIAEEKYHDDSPHHDFEWSDIAEMRWVPEATDAPHSTHPSTRP